MKRITGIEILIVVVILGIIAAVVTAHQNSTLFGNDTSTDQGEWRMIPLNNGGFYITGDLPTFTQAAAIPSPVFSFIEIDGQGKERGAAHIPVSNILSIAAKDFPIYGDEGTTITGFRYATAIRYGDGRWGWVSREAHLVAAELIGLGWVDGVPPVRWRHPREDDVPFPAEEYR